VSNGAEHPPSGRFPDPAVRRRSGSAGSRAHPDCAARHPRECRRLPCGPGRRSPAPVRNVRDGSGDPGASGSRGSPTVMCETASRTWPRKVSANLSSHQHTGAGEADLAGVAVLARDGLSRGLQIRVCVDDERRLAPSSMLAGVMLRAAAWPISWAVSVEPVKLNRSMSGCCVRRRRPSSPMPWTTLRTPAGTPAASATSAISEHVSGAHSGGLTTMSVARRQGRPDLPGS